MRRGRAAILAVALLGQGFPGFQPQLECGRAYAQRRNGDFGIWLREEGAGLLGDSDENARFQAAWRIRYAAEAGEDVFPAVPNLVKAISDSNENVRGYAAFALALHHIRKKEWPKVASLIGNEKRDVKESASWAIGKAAELRYDMGAYAKKLAKHLSDENDIVRWNASKAIALNHLNGGARKRVDQLLNHEDEDVRQGAEEALRIFRPR